MALLPEDYVHTAGHYCQAEGCPFNTRRPGHPGRCVEAGSYCIWHDDAAMDSALETREGRSSVRHALTMLRQSGAEHDGVALWELALQILPLEFALSARMCRNPDCLFSLRRIGQPGRARQTGGLCAWCDTEVLAHREGSTQGRRLIAFALGKWATHLDVLLLAWGKLSWEFRAAAVGIPRERDGL